MSDFVPRVSRTKPYRPAATRTHVYQISGNTGHVKNHDDFLFGARLCFTGIRHRDKNHVRQTHAVGTTNNETRTTMI